MIENQFLLKNYPMDSFLKEIIIKTRLVKNLQTNIACHLVIFYNLVLSLLIENLTN